MKFYLKPIKSVFAQLLISSSLLNVFFFFVAFLFFRMFGLNLDEFENVRTRTSLIERYKQRKWRYYFDIAL